MPPRKVLPWREVQVRSDVLLPVNVRVPEPTSKKLDFFAKESGLKKQDITARALEMFFKAKAEMVGLKEADFDDPR